MLWINGFISEPQYCWVLGNIIEDEKQKFDLIRNLIEIVHCRLRPETFKSREELEQSTIAAPEGEFEQLVNMNQGSSFYGK